MSSRRKWIEGRIAKRRSQASFRPEQAHGLVLVEQIEQDAQGLPAIAGQLRIAFQLFRSGDRAVFVFGFAKSDRDDLEPDELDDVGTAAKLFLGYDTAQLELAKDKGELWEVNCHDQAL